MRKVKIVFMSFLVMMLAGSAWAAGPSDHVKIAPNNQGDALIYPFYAAIDGGFETKLTVVNTSDEYSTVAKAVVRSEVYSQELLDFLIYLSPSDVWTGTLKWDADNGGPVLYSEDDSILVESDAFASADDPVNQPLEDTDGENDSNMMGYVYVINAASTDTLDTIEGSSTKVAKTDIKEWYDGLNADLEEGEETYLPENILAGFMDFNVEDVSLTSGLNAVTLRDYENQTKLSIADETFLGFGADNNLFEIEAILSKTDATIPYLNTDEDVTLHFFNFPTKYDYPVDDDPLGPYFLETANDDFNVPYDYDPYDLKENTVKDPSPIFSPSPPGEKSEFGRELNWVVSSDFDDEFEEGFTRYSGFPSPTSGTTKDGTDLDYTGAPFIPMQLNLGQSGLSMKYGAWTDGVVSTTPEEIEIEDYHYSDDSSF